MRGFSLIELVISIAVISIIAATATLNLTNYRKTIALESAAESIIGELRLTQNKAASGEDGNKDGQADNWGVRFSNSTNDKYEIFYGNSYNPANVVETIYLPSSIVFTDPSDSLSKEVVFTKTSGTTTAASLTIATRDNSQTKTITIDKNGRVSSN